MSALGVLSGFRQLVAMNAAPYFLGIAAVAFLAGTSGGFIGGLKWRAGQVAEAKLDTEKAKGVTKDLRTEMANSAAAGFNLAIQQQADSQHALDASVKRIEQAMALGFDRLGIRISGEVQTLRGNLDDPKFDCLTRLPYPAGSLLLLQRPGGFVTAGSDQGSGAAAAAGDLPPASAIAAPAQ